MSQSSSDGSNDHSKRRPLTESAAHRILSHSRRRIVLDVLKRRQTPIDLDTLAAEVAEREQGPTVDEVDSIDRVALSLHHVHIPKLETAGIVEYAASSTQIEAFRDQLSP